MKRDTAEMQQLVSARCLATAGVRLSTAAFTAAAVNRARTRMLRKAHQVLHMPRTADAGTFLAVSGARKAPAVGGYRQLSQSSTGGADVAGSCRKTFFFRGRELSERAPVLVGAGWRGHETVSILRAATLTRFCRIELVQRHSDR